MDLLSSIVIGLLQGIFEWLPISSQGGLMIYFSNVLKIAPDIALNYSIFLHLGTTLAALIYFRKEIYNLFTKSSIKDLVNSPFKTKNKDSIFLRFLIVAVFFSLLVSVPIYFYLGNNISKLSISVINLVIGLLLIATGFLILFSKKKKLKTAKLSLKNSIFLGLFQGLSILPGVSRSGITTSVLLFEGFNAEKAFRISFILAIPTVLIGELGLLVFNGFSSFDPFIIISLLVSFVVGLLTIDLLIKFAKRVNFSTFCFILGVIYIFLFLL
ncbi:MAG: undecaprenyl-diphosphate phosphatase [archaeon]|jgi:undecaprenyl-diphosphatase|nr:undecaprenyl-diphosphate phosphatase [archaeon]MDD2477951.1 undecaprenyl-diphosphate phosphatase [Candidatus ainarchaeum sp.]MDD3084847.1 undecaprenyl-diphosphate phosphatase [Candidatus ainarchaeum sp.]MDD4662762.1 undecaprenyl-diphosphate phosphatase [Candidatus ainarchaeum sp.]